jgi:type I restriction enzyme S subunit
VKNAQLNFDDVQYVEPPLESAESKRIKVEEGDLLISITADLGRTAVVDKKTASEGAYINQHIALIRLSKEFNPIFVAHYLENEGKNQFLKYGQAAAKKGLNFDSLRSLKIPKPPIELQNQFAEDIKEIFTLEVKQKKSSESIQGLFSSILSTLIK